MHSRPSIYSMFVLLSVTLIISCTQSDDPDQHYFDSASQNGELVNEGYNRCLAFTCDWLKEADPVSGLIPENLEGGRDIWNGHNPAADNYPFMVLTSYLLDSDLFHGRMLEILQTERMLTSRLGSMPAAYSFSRQDFVNDQIDTARIIFSTSEYMKDGLVPLLEYMGRSPWSKRMIEMLDDLGRYMEVAEKVSDDLQTATPDNEVNGELLQVLSRVYWMTREEQYLDWAITIGDYYLLGHPDILMEAEVLRLRDHGCEILGGLSELYATLHFEDPERKRAYQHALYRLMDRVLDIGRNDHGMFFNEVNMKTGEVVDSAIVDNWGYLYNAYYTVYLMDQEVNYREAVLKPLTTLKEHYHQFDWERGSADGYADAIESGITTYHYEPVNELADWIDDEIRVMWNMQDTKLENSGIIEGWHGDGNFARTTIMYCLWKSRGVTVQPWREDIKLGAHLVDDTLYISLRADENWKGRLLFDRKRHKEFLNLPLDYPRINQFPEWYPVSGTETFLLSYDIGSQEYDGKDLIDGIPLEVKDNREVRIKVTPTE